MGKCINHPTRETDIFCSKDNTYYCEECACCRSPKRYCKFRQSCLIWHNTREGKKKREKGRP